MDTTTVGDKVRVIPEVLGANEDWRDVFPQFWTTGEVVSRRNSRNVLIRFESGDEAWWAESDLTPAT